ncbi:MAG: LysR family transcriptional regulator substrate-binding protein, partial [Longicatena sp.]|nr:LysR family transcriptional regulator substrate-binding protein [Longicatena sp.]
YVLLPYLKDFIKEYPHIRISIECQSSYHTIEALRNGKVDIGLIGEPENKYTDIEFLPVKEIQDGFVTTESYLENLKKRTPAGNDSETLLSNALSKRCDGNSNHRGFIARRRRYFSSLIIQELIEHLFWEKLLDKAQSVHVVH